MAVFDSLWDDLKHHFRTGNMVTKLLLINVFVWAGLKIIWIGIRLFNPDFGEAMDAYTGILHGLSTRSNLGELITHPWGLLTAMFVHDEFWGHLMSNLIALGLFGRVVGDLIGDRRILPIYLMGGLVGGVFFILYSNVVYGYNQFAYGASAAAMAMVGTGLFLAPDYEFNFLLIGRVKLKWVALLLFFLDLVGIADRFNDGGHIAHIGGFGFGALFIHQLREGNDWSEPVNRFLQKISGWLGLNAKPRRSEPRGKSPLFVSWQKPEQVSDIDPELNYESQLNVILDKIKKQGYSNLSQEEKDFLERASKR